MPKTTIAIIGIGSIGGTIASYAATQTTEPYELHCLARGNYAALSEQGLELTCPDKRKLSAPASKALHFYRKPGELPACDILVLCIPISENARLLPQLKPRVRQDTVIVTLQNGLDFEPAIREHFPKNPLYSGTCWIKASHDGTSFQHIFGHDVFLGPFNRQLATTDTDASVQALFSSMGLNIRLSDNVKSVQLTKLALNIPFFLLVAREGYSVAEILHNTSLNEERERLQREIVDTARRYGSPVNEAYIDDMLGELRKMPVIPPDDRTQQKDRMAKEVPQNAGPLLALFADARLLMPQVQAVYDGIIRDAQHAPSGDQFSP